MLSSSQSFKLCENLRKEDNLNNTFRKHVLPAAQRHETSRIAVKLAKVLNNKRQSTKRSVRKKQRLSSVAPNIDIVLMGNMALTPVYSDALLHKLPLVEMKGISRNRNHNALIINASMNERPQLCG